MPANDKTGTERLDRIVAAARRAREQRQGTYRDQALRIHPWICARCAREFTHANVRLLTVHHRDGNHENNPSDGSNWELLCAYCHENEHARGLDAAGRDDAARDSGHDRQASHRPFAGLKDLLKKNKD